MYEDEFFGNNLEIASEAIKLENTTANKFYRNQKNIYFHKGDGSVVVTLTPSFDLTLMLMNDNFPWFYKSGYRAVVSTTNINTRIGAKVIKKINATQAKKEYYAKVKNHAMRFYPIHMADSILSSNKQYVYDISDIMSQYRLYQYKRSMVVMNKNFMTFLDGELKKIPESYKKKILYIPLDYWSRFGGFTIGITADNMSHPLSIILRLLYKSPALLEPLVGYEILLSNGSSGEFMWFEITEDILEPSKARKLYQRIRLNLTKMHLPMPLSNEVQGPATQETDNTNESGIINANAQTNTRVDYATADIVKKQLIASVTKKFTGNDAPDTSLSNSETEIVDDEESATMVQESDETSEEISDTINTFLNENPNIIEEDPANAESIIEKEVKQKVFVNKFIPERTEKELKNVLQLDEKQKKVIDQPVDVMKSKIIDQTSFDDVIKTDDKNITNLKFINFEKNYAEKRYKYDVNKAVAGLSNGSKKIFVTSVKEEDSSDQFNLKDTMTYELEDEDGRKTTLKLDIPRLIDGNYIYIGGSKKMIGKQRIFKPIAKTGPDTVQLVTFYNKCFITRHGSNVDSKSVALASYIKANAKKFKVVFGNAKIGNAKYNTTIEFDTFSKSMMRMTLPGKVKGQTINIAFDLSSIKNTFENAGYEPKVPYDSPTGFIFGYVTDSSGKILNEIATNDNISVTDQIIEMMSEEDQKTIISNTKGGGRFVYARARIMSKFIPIVLFMLFCDGFTVMMRKCKIDYEVFDSIKEFNESKPKEIRSNYGIIQTADKVVAYPVFPTENALLLNGMRELPISSYTLAELDSKDTYIDMLPLYYASAAMAFNLDQFKDFMIDENSKEILNDFGLPTDLVELMFHACKLLKNNQYMLDNDMRNMRIRSSEIISQIIYQILTTQYGNYRKTAHKKNPTKITVPQDAVIKALLSTSLVNDDLIINPYYTVESDHGVTIKASVSTPPNKPTITLTGTNRVDGYGMNKRGYDQTMAGVFGITTSADANVGIQRQLTLEPNITSTKGYVECPSSVEDIKAMNNAQLLTPTELTTPTVLYDDPQRSSMMRSQTTKMLLADEMSPLLMGNKTESVIAYHIPDTLCFKAKEDGKVIDEKDGVFIVEYKDGRHEAFDTNSQIYKSGEGMDIEITLKPYVKVGQKFKKMEVLASDPRAFRKNSDDLGASATIGVLAKVAILSIYDIYEDSEPISQRLSEKLAVQAIEKKDAVLTANTYVESIAKIGDHVSIGDPLLVFDPDSGDPEVAKFLREYTKGGGISDAIVQTGKSIIKAPISGIVTDIEIWRTVDIEDLSDSLAKIVKDYNKRIESKNKFIDQYKNKGDNAIYKCGQLMTRTTEKVDSNFGKVMGVQVDDGVIIRFHVKHKDVIKKGDKVSNFTAMKGVTSHVMPEGQEPWSSFRPDEPIDAIIAPLSISNRKTDSIFRFLWGNKVLIYGKEKLLNDYFKD